ncbi:alkyl sulfatase dimerization domain-containing protein [Vibrio sp. SCSIO 43136]|uniref:alkyl sulfatase dimerization domain-containing protein n=1 Tax=Vibrio sp. SCSIO 43136 TaxID=2819101 RepID=UPI002074B680|nr:alkyl sulfatase dimerization domain-containing protein [Vibrio sp. SCSIO 43136]USD68023.1 MBL fold metallo-hydrolase [Vibrio sp. SCSIO 43136]
MSKMTKLAILVSAALSTSVIANTSLSIDEKSVVSPTGAILAESLNNKDAQYTDGAYEVTPGVWSVTGLGMDNVNVVETENGIVVFDGGLSGDYAKKAMSLLPEHVAKKPVVGLIYTHWHYVVGAGAWNVSEDTVVVAHENHKQEFSTALSTDSPTAQVRQLRGAIQLGSFLPAEGEDSPSVTGLVNVSFTPEQMKTYTPPTKLVGDEETTITIDGMDFVTYMGHTDTMDGISIYIPEKKVSVDNTFWAHGLFNYSTLRGDRWRDIDLMEASLEWLLSKDIDHSLKVHGKPVTGEVFKEQLEHQLIATKALVSETDKAIGKGMAPDELQYNVQLPEEIADSPWVEQNYGEWSYHVRRYYNHVMHWFGNDSIDLHPLPRNVEAEKMVEAMGGTDKVIELAKNAQQNSEHQWAAQLATYAIRSGEESAKQVKADALRSMAQQATASNTRNWMLTHALVLEGKLELPMILTGEY